MQQRCNDRVSQVCGDFGKTCEARRSNSSDEHGYISGNIAIMLRKRPGSAMVGYDLKVPRTPRRANAAYNGSYLYQEVIFVYRSAESHYSLKFDANGGHVNEEMYLNSCG